MRLTTLAIIGLALSVTGPSVHAADLPPAPILDDSEELLGSGWYLRGDIGVADQLWARRGRDEGRASVPPLVKSRLSGDMAIGGGAGYQFSPWFRADLTIDHRFGATFKGMRIGSGQALDRADFEATTFLANGYVDLPFWSGVTPYLGAGLGVAFNRFDGAERQVQVAGAPPETVLLPSRTGTVLAWALMGGVAIDLTDSLKLDLGYRYARLGDAHTRLEGSEPPIRAKHLAAHEFRIGARVLFD